MTVRRVSPQDAHGLILQITSKHEGGIHGLMDLVVQSARKLSAISSPMHNADSPVGSPLRLRRSGNKRMPGSGSDGRDGAGDGISDRRFISQAGAGEMEPRGLNLSDLPATPPASLPREGSQLY